MRADEVGALGRPVAPRELGHAPPSPWPRGVAAGLAEHRRQRQQRLAHVGAHRHLGREVLAHVPVDQADVHDRHAVGQRLDLAPHRHAHRVGAEHDQQVELGRARRAPASGRATGRPCSRRARTGSARRRARSAGRRARPASRRTWPRPRSASLLTISSPTMITGRSASSRRLARLSSTASDGRDARVDARRGAELDAGLGIEDVARQRDEHRAGRRRHRHLGGAAHDARQVLQPRHLDRPFHQRLGDRHQRIVEQRLGQAVALLLLAGGQDHRRARELGVEERAHGVAEPGRHVHVAGDELAAGAREAVGHGHHQRFLQAQHVGEVRVLLQRVHDRQLGGAGVAEQMRDALVLQEREEGGAAGDAVHGGTLVIRTRQPKSGGPAEAANRRQHRGSDNARRDGNRAGLASYALAPP